MFRQAQRPGNQGLVFNPNTIARVYTELEREGVLNAHPGLGVFIARPRQELTERARQQRLIRHVDALLTEAVHLGFAPAEVTGLVAERMKRFRWELGEKKTDEEAVTEPRRSRRYRPT